MVGSFIGIHQADAFAKYCLDLCGTFLNLRFAVDSNGPLTYGDSAKQSLTIPLCQPYTVDTIPPVPDDKLIRAVQVSGVDFPFDLFKAIRFWMCDEAEIHHLPTSLDKHSRLIYDRSAQAYWQHDGVPIVNAYMLLFGAWLEAQIGVAKPQRARILLTHDVDHPIVRGDLGHHTWRLRSCLGKRNLRGALSLLKQLPHEAKMQLTPTRNEHWNFDDIASLEAGFGFRSTYFFASRPRWFPAATSRDVDYDIGSPRFRALFDTMLRRGESIGLHPSYNAYQSLANFRDERARLGELAKTPVLGCRHHYWHIGMPLWNTLELHGQVGLAYDMSIAFNDAAGYRLGIGQPFYPWHPDKNAVVPVLQIPSLLMDGALLYDPARSVESIEAEVERVLEMAKRYHATAAIDWHVRSSFPRAPNFKRWARVYETILQRLADEPDIEVVMPIEILREQHFLSGTFEESEAS